MGRLRAWFKKHYHRMAGKRRLAFGVFIDRERFEVVLFGWAHIWYWFGPIERAKIRTIGPDGRCWTFKEVQGTTIVNHKMFDRAVETMLPVWALSDLPPEPKVSMSSQVVLKSPAEVLWSLPLDHYRFVISGQVLMAKVRSEMVSLADRSEQVYRRVEDDHATATHILYEGKFHEIDWAATNADNTIFDRLSVVGGMFFRRSELLPGSWYKKIKDRYGARERTEATGTNQG